MDGIIKLVKGGMELHHQVFSSTVQELKWIFTFLKDRSKDSVSVKKLHGGERDWICTKEVRGWRVDK